MFPDYYLILGVNPTDTFDTIKSAFRKKAMQCHPDRGGSVEAMKEINEAWEILSSPEKRRTYDAMRANPNNQEHVRAASDNSRDAKQRSDDFPRKWSDFERFLDEVTEDFKKASYRTATFCGCPIPTAGNSVSGLIFIITGALLLGGLVGLPAYQWFDKYSTDHRFSRFSLPGFALIACAFIGGTIGAGVHKSIADSLKSGTATGSNSNTSEPGTTENRIVTCGKCQQKLRVPQLNAKLVVTCSKCGDKFDVL